MKKRQRKQFLALLLIASVTLTTTGCGSGKKNSSTTDEDGGDLRSDGTRGQSANQQAKDGASTPGGSETAVQSPAQSPAPQSPVQGVSSHPLVGTYVQVDNRQSRIVIAEGLLLTTNLEFASPSGNGTRLTPAFPHGLRYRMATDDYRTVGSYNDGTSIFKNIEIRVRMDSSNKSLDVTLIPQGVTSTGSLSSGGGSAVDGAYGLGTRSAMVTGADLQEAGGYRGSVIPCPPPPLPLPPPLPYPLPYPCPDPCPDESNQLKYLYRYVRVE